MNGMCCLLSDRAISVSTDDEHIQCDHTNFLLYRLPSDWLRLPSQWQRLCVFEVVVNVYFFVGVLVCVCMCMHLDQSVEGTKQASFQR